MPSRMIIERGHTICECDDFMQIPPRFDTMMRNL